MWRKPPHPNGNGSAADLLLFTWTVLYSV